jgi:hypothetical protein
VQGEICSLYGYIVALAFMFSKHDPEAVAGGDFVGGPAVEPEVALAAEAAPTAIYGSVPARRGFVAANAVLNVSIHFLRE